METGFSLGSNVGNRLENLQHARNRLLETPGAQRVAQSPVYETEPVEVLPAYQSLFFLNAVLIVEADLPPGEWLHVTQRIERDLGRVRKADQHKPRTIDIDILYSGDQYIESGMLIVPHPRWSERRFVLQPLADVRPTLRIPNSSQTIRTLLARLPRAEKVVRFAEAEAW